MQVRCRGLITLFGLLLLLLPGKIFAQENAIGHRFPSFAQYGPVDGAISSALQPLWIGEQTAAVALANAEKAANKLIKG